MAWCSVKAQGQIYLYNFTFIYYFLSSLVVESNDDTS